MTRSQEIVKQLMEKDSRVKYKGFNKAIIKAFSKDPGVIEDDVDYLKQYLGPVPDAYLINEEDKEVLWFEIEDTHRVSDDKLRKLYGITFALDYCFWNMEVIIFDRYGRGGPVEIFLKGMELSYK